MDKLLVAVDGSPHAYNALDIAASLAKQNNASVIVLHAVSGKDLSRELRKGIEIEYADEIFKKLKSIDFHVPLPDEAQYASVLLSHSDNVARVVNKIASENVIKRAMSFLHKRDVESVESALVEGDPADQILETAKKHHVDTIVIGCRGTGKLQGLLLGSVSQSVVHHADCSVIVVK